ncbi:GGDEF domain-containing protein [uncultured Ilyobacter sp.]|uniref:GGDEF domain-containing protein n=1 Tax=uncultured Ilyobacter sp. TaxID=544433 RepID=UPI0029C7804A|nr:GGDEF domain-containing protein [uncultured Ilyobacter sp.]
MNLNLNNSKILLDYLTDNSNDPIVTLTEDFKIKEYNKAFERLVDDPHNMKSTFFEETFGKISASPEKHTDESHNIKEISASYRSKSGSVTHLQGILIKKNNEIVIIFKNFMICESQIIDEISKMNIEMSNLARELSKKNFQLKLANEKITKLLNTDFLTGLYNRKCFFERLEELVSLKKRKRCFNIGVIFADIDFFKSINDTYGHDTGDFVLIKFSQMLKESLRKEDIVARIGGEEFCIIVQCTEDNFLVNISEKIRKNCELLIFENTDIKITASFGATFYREWEEIDCVIKRADENMYAAKSSGRNKVIFSP